MAKAELGDLTFKPPGASSGVLPAEWLALNALPLLAWLVGLDGRPIAFNEPFLEYTGLSAPDVLRIGPTGYAHPDDVAGVLAWRKSLRAGLVTDLQVRLRRNDGTYRWFLGRARELPRGGAAPANESGAFTAGDGSTAQAGDGTTLDRANQQPLQGAPPVEPYFVGVLTDVTEQRAQREELEGQRRLQTAILQHMPGGLAVTDPQDRLILVNDRFIELLGPPPPGEDPPRPYWRERGMTLDGRAPGLASDGRKLDARDFPLSRTIRGETVTDQEVYYDHPDGRRRRLRLNTSAVLSEAGEVLAAVLMVHDVTIERAAEADLREQALLLDLAQDAIIVTDLEGNVRLWNKSAERLYGFTLVEALHKNVHDLLSTRWPEPFEDIMETLLRDGRWEGELTHLCADGSSVIVWSRQALQRDQNERPIAYLEINRDITAKRQADEALATLNATLEERVRERTSELGDALDALRERNAEQETFLYTVSHDLRAPLLSISGMNSLLEEAIVDAKHEDALQAVERIAFNTRKMDALLTDLLTLSRVGRGGERAQSLTLESATRSALSELESILRERGLEVSFPPRWHAVRIEPGEAYQLAANLIGNAVRYAGANGQAPRVRIECALQHDPQGPRVYYRVHDNGPGVPEAYRERVFELFKQVNPNAGGTGVGLAIVKRIAERHGGRVTLGASTLLGGACFCVSFPPVE